MLVGPVRILTVSCAVEEGSDGRRFTSSCSSSDYRYFAGASQKRRLDSTWFLTLARSSARLAQRLLAQLRQEKVHNAFAFFFVNAAYCTAIGHCVLVQPIMAYLGMDQCPCRGTPPKPLRSHGRQASCKRRRGTLCYRPWDLKWSKVLHCGAEPLATVLQLSSLPGGQTVTEGSRLVQVRHPQPGVI